MCLAIPAKVIKIYDDNQTATVAIGDVKKDISLSLVEDIKKDDFVLVHVGFALSKLSESDAKKTLDLFAETSI
ncbi:MAG: hydrogenase assembly protein HupF [Gammaproteobacteria bacterium]|nr:MAG: hydrogenase assembly protein HupF [Gammaproteobacteria bacterium]